MSSITRVAMRLPLRRALPLVLGLVCLACGAAPSAAWARLQYVRSWSVGGHHDIPDPDGVAVNRPAGVIYVADFDGGIVQRFSLSGKLLGSFGSDGIRPGQLDGPADLAVDPPTGHVYVVENALNIFLGSTNRVSEFTAGGKFIRTFGGSGTRPGRFEAPSGLALDPVARRLYVGDISSDRIQVFTTGGSFVHVFGGAHRMFTEPFGLAFDPSARRLEIAAASRSGRYTPGGRRVAPLKNYLSAVSILSGPGDVAALLPSDGPKENTVFLYTPGGRLLESASRPGSTDQADNPHSDSLTAVAADCAGYVYATDSNHARLEVFRDPALASCRVS